MTTAVYIGRFNPFHSGHAEVLSRALLRYKNVIVLIGSSNLSRSVKNPFTFSERSYMINNWFLSNQQKFFGCALTIKALKDHPYNDQMWIEEVQSLVLGNPDLTLVGANKDNSTWYLKVFGDLFKLDLSEEVSISGRKTSATEVRNGLFESIGASNSDIYELIPETTTKFLRKFINTQEYTDLLHEYEFIKKYRKAWEAAPYAPTFLTVDSVVVQSGHVLVVERAAQPGKGLWALPGGFVEQDEKLVDAAVRELCEETRIGLSKAQLYGSILSKEIFDLPDRSLRGRTVTTAFLFKLADDKELPKVKPQVGEVRKVMWLPIARANSNPCNWFEDHHAILSTMLGRL